MHILFKLTDWTEVVILSNLMVVDVHCSFFFVEYALLLLYYVICFFLIVNMRVIIIKLLLLFSCFSSYIVL